jgi:peptidoglycan/LPS O-acetylase OafA/YrhL
VSKPSQIRSLDTLRGLAALSVAAFHSRDLLGDSAIVPHAYMAVDLFFVLSGFILMHRYAAGVISGELSGVRFAQLRFARLYPLYLAATLLGALLFAAKILMKAHVDGTVAEVARAVLYNAVLLPDPVVSQLRPDGALFPFLGQAWSVLWEFVLSAAFFVWLRRGGKGLGWILAISMATLGVMAMAYKSIDGGWVWATMPMGGVRALTGFALGILVARIAGPMASHPGRARLAAIAGGVSALAAATYIGFSQATAWPLELAIAFLALPLIVGGLALTRTPWLENRAGDVLGGASYSIYLLHRIVFDIAIVGMKRTHLSPSPVFGFAGLIGVVALSWCCWRAFENPCRVWIQSLGVKRVSTLAQRRLDMALRRDATRLSPAAAEAQRAG